jgi:AraC-like DNA-binding protein
LHAWGSFLARLFARCIRCEPEGAGVLEKRDDDGPGGRRPKVTLLNAAELAERCQRSHLQPSADFAPYVSVAWTLRWNLEGLTPFVQQVLPDPCVQIVVAAEGAYLQGVVTRAFSATLAGTGFVLGLKFWPGGFFPFARRSVADFTDRRVPLADVLPAADREPLARFAAAAEGRLLLDRLESLLRDAGPAPDPRVQQVRAVVDRMATDGTILSVEQAAAKASLSPRALQRLCRSYVGVGPKWLIRRFRLQEAAARVEAGETEDWAALSLRLGYFDQAHFVNEFTALVGQSPAAYARRIRSRRADSRA